MTFPRRAARGWSFPAAFLVGGVLLLLAGGEAMARRARPLGIYVPALFKRVPPAMLVDDPRGGAASLAGLYRTVDLAGAPDQIVITLESGSGAPRVTREHFPPKASSPLAQPVAGATISGNRLVAPALGGRFVLVPYQVERRVEGRTELVCRAGLLLDGYLQLFQREEAPGPCPEEVARRVAAGSLKVRRLLVEGRWALAVGAVLVRSRPLPDAAIVGTLRKGDEVDVIDRLAGWLMIHGGGVEGFVPAASIAP